MNDQLPHATFSTTRKIREPGTPIRRGSSITRIISTCSAASSKASSTIASAPSFQFMRAHYKVVTPLRRHIEADFIAPCRIGDLLQFAMTLVALGRTSLKLTIDGSVEGSPRPGAARHRLHFGGNRKGRRAAAAGRGAAKGTRDADGARNLKRRPTATEDRSPRLRSRSRGRSPDPFASRGRSCRPEHFLQRIDNSPGSFERRVRRHFIWPMRKITAFRTDGISTGPRGRARSRGRRFRAGLRNDPCDHGLWQGHAARRQDDAMCAPSCKRERAGSLSRRRFPEEPYRRWRVGLKGSRSKQIP